MTILPKNEKTENSDSDSSSSSGTSAARHSPRSHETYSHKHSCHDEDCSDNASQSKNAMNPRCKRRLRACARQKQASRVSGLPVSLPIPASLIPTSSQKTSPSPTSSQVVISSMDRPGAVHIGQEASAAYSSDDYNSAEEYEERGKLEAERERKFEEYLWKEWGFIIKRTKEDGNCLFRSISDQIYGDEEMHSTIRKLCTDYMMKNADYFSQFVTEDFDKYIRRKQRDSCYGNHLEMQALSEMYNRNIEVYQYKRSPIVFYSPDATDNEPLRVSYHGSIHYNSIVDPKRPAVGVGLGLPGYNPSSEDQNVTDRAIKESEIFTIEESMLKDKLKTTEIEATSEAIEKAIARESYLLWLQEQSKFRKNNGESSSTCPIQVLQSSVTSPTNEGSPSNSPPRSPLLRSQSLNNLLTVSCSKNTSSSTSPLQFQQDNSYTYPFSSPPSLNNSGRNSPVTFKRHPSSPSFFPSKSHSNLISPTSSCEKTKVFSVPKQSTHKYSYKKLPSPGSSHTRVSPYPSPRSSPHNSKANSPRTSPRASPVNSPRSSPLLNPPHYPTGETDPAAVQEKSPPHYNAYPFEYSSIFDQPDPTLGMSDWGDDSIIAAVMAASQQEYFQSQIKEINNFECIN